MLLSSPRAKREIKEKFFKLLKFWDLNFPYTYATLNGNNVGAIGLRGVASRNSCLPVAPSSTLLLVLLRSKSVQSANPFFVPTSFSLILPFVFFSSIPVIDLS